MLFERCRASAATSPLWDSDAQLLLLLLKTRLLVPSTCCSLPKPASNESTPKSPEMRSPGSHADKCYFCSPYVQAHQKGGKKDRWESTCSSRTCRATSLKARAKPSLQRDFSLPSSCCVSKTRPELGLRLLHHNSVVKFPRWTATKEGAGHAAEAS